MPPPTAKLRLLLLLPIIPALFSVAMLTMLMIDEPIRFVNLPKLQVYYIGGRIQFTHMRANESVGPSAEVITDPVSGDESYKNFQQMNAWRDQLPRPYFDFLGIGYMSDPKVVYGSRFFTADRVRTLSINIEYFLFLAAVFLVWAIRRYRRAKRAYARLTSGFCQKCGYDLRATPDRCPECGAERTTV